jgi:hypothetical protein
MPPNLPTEFIPHFARGAIFGAGGLDRSRISWAGNGRLMNSLKQAIKLGAEVGEPEVRQAGRSCTLTWTAPDDLCRLGVWLDLPPPPATPQE